MLAAGPSISVLALKMHTAKWQICGRSDRAFIQKNRAIAVCRDVFSERSIGFEGSKPRFFEKMIHFSESVQVRLKIHGFALQQGAAVVQFVDAGGKLRLAAFIVKVFRLQNQVKALGGLYGDVDPILRIVCAAGGDCVDGENKNAARR